MKNNDSLSRENKSSIVVIGGGTGTYTVLFGLKKLNKDLTAIVTMMDSGGSSGRLRDEFGVLPPGDIRQSLVALSGDASILRKLFDYRYVKGESLQGHSFGNLFLTALADITGGMDKAIIEASRVLNIKGKVLPVTTDQAHLLAKYENGLEVKGEGNIDEPKHDGKLRIKELILEPKPKAYPQALEAIEKADFIVLGPGDLYTSIIPNLLVPGVAAAICKASAKKVYIVNLMTKYGQTFGFKASDHVGTLEKYLGESCIDYVLINNTLLPEDILKRYKEEYDYPVADDLKDDSYKIIRTDLLAKDPIRKAEGDVLKRSLIRHDSVKLAKIIINIANG